MKNINKKKIFMTIGLSSSIALAAVAPKAIDVFASDFNRTGSGSVNTPSSGVKPLVADDKVKAVLNGEKNFNATVALTTEAGLGSGTLINEDTIVTVAHNFVHLNTKSNPISVENNVNKSGDVHIATLPNGKQVRFSNDDVKFWNREGFVNGFKNDLAVIKLRNKFTGETPATVSNNVASLKAADTIHVFGFPKGKLQPILNGKVESVENYGANIMGVAYQGSAPGMSGGGLYNAQGELIGVHQNGVEGLRAGGISFSKEQLDWVNAIARGENAQPVYLKDDVRNDDKDKDKTTKVEFKKDRVRINDLYELDSKPYLIVKETSDMKIDEDPGLVAALNNVKGHSEQEERARENIKKLMAYKTGKVFKVKSYEADGTEGWRYFRTWTSDVNIPGRAGLTKIPHEAHDWFEKNIGDDVRYSSEDSMVVGRARGEMIAYESYGNIGMVTWTMHEPSAPGEVPQPNEPDFPHGDGKVATVYERYEGDTHIRSNEMSATYGTEYKFVNIGTKPTIKEEIIERRSVKYRANPDLDVEEKVIQEGSDKVKKTIMKYTLKKESDKRSDVKSLLKETEFDVPKDSKLLPTVENGGIVAETSEEFTELKDKIIEKRVPKDTQKEEKIEPKVIYQKDDTREKGQPDIVEKGQDGEVIYEFPMIVDENTGEVTKGKPVLVKDTKPTDTIVKVAAKDKVVTEEIQPDVIYERDDTRDYGTPNVEIKGELGKKAITTEYTVNEKTGEVTENVKEPVITPAGVTRIKVGTRKRVETIRKDGNVIERLTEYELDSKTGKITEKITEKLLSSNGNVPAPVLDIPEYTGVLSGNGIDENGNQITPPVVDVPEFNGGVAPNDAPKIDVPEYKGEVKKPEEPQQTTTTQEVKKPEEPKQTTTTQKEDAKPKLPKTGAESVIGLTATGLIATIGAAFVKLRKKK